MLNCKGVIEKIWWVIPPVVIVFGIPLVYTFKGMMEFSHPMDLFIWCYGKNIHIYIYNEIFSFFGRFIIIFTFASMGIGYYLSRKESVLLRIISPIIAALLGYFVSHIVVLLVMGVA